MTQLNIDAILSGNLTTKEELSTIDTTKLTHLLKKYHIGSFLNSPVAVRHVKGWSGPDANEWNRMIGVINQHSIEIDNIPTLFGIDSVHGANYITGATIFPQQLNAAATFNRELVESMGAITAKDTRAAGIAWCFAPILDIAVNTAWARVFETFGECPYVASEMGGALIRGLQGERVVSEEIDSKSESESEDGQRDGERQSRKNRRPAIGRADKVAATFKHFIGYSNPRDGHDRVENWIPERQLLEYFVPPFEVAIQQHQVATGMISYTDLNGVPLTANSDMTITLLRDELEFNGVLVTDFNEIFNLQSWHRLTPTVKEAIALALRTSSLDMAMLQGDAIDEWFTAMMELVKSGVIPIERLDIAVARILQLKKDLNLFTTFPLTEVLTGTDKSKAELLATIGNMGDRTLALSVAHESIVLLANDGTLPVLLHKASGQPSTTSDGVHLKSGEKVRKILVVGPTGRSLARQTGGWTFHWEGAASEEEFKFGTTIYDAIKQLMKDYSFDGDSITVTYEPGVDIDGSYTEEMFDRAIRAGEEADLIIACVGEETYAEKPGDISSSSLPWGQQNLINQLTRLPKHSKTESSSGSSSQKNKHVVLVLVEGRPRLLDVIDLTRLRAVVYAGLPGPEGGQAVADVIFGLVNPSGRLPITYPSKAGEMPLQYYHKHSQATSYKPQWPLGAGLSYTTFEYSSLRLSADSVEPNGTLTVTVDITNKGTIMGKEVVLCFLSDLYRVVTPEVKRLRGFEKLMLQPNETRTVNFTLGYVSWPPAAGKERRDFRAKR